MKVEERRETLLVVDDTAVNLDILLNLLGGEFDISVARDGASALRLAAKVRPRLILLDIMIPVMDGFEVCRRLKADPSTAEIPVIFITSLSQEFDEAHGLELGAVDYITRPFSPALVKARVHKHVELERHRDELERMVEERTHDLRRTRDATIRCLAMLAEMRDSETGEHIERTREYALLLARFLARQSVPGRILTDDDLDLLYQSAPLHDIGKVGVPDSILLKPGRLSAEEFAEIRRHPVYGGDVLRRAEEQLGEISFLTMAREIAETHHEKWDGSGYPYGLKGDNIPLVGRIMAVADVYDALRSERPYKEAFSHVKAVEIIREGAGTHFDPVLVEAFCRLEREFCRISETLGLRSVRPV